MSKKRISGNRNTVPLNPMKKASAKQLKVLAVIAVLAVFFSLMSPGFRRYTTIVSILDYSYYIVLMAIGVTFPLITGGVDLSVGTGLICYSLAGGYLIQFHHFPVWAGMLATVLMGAVIGTINGCVIAYMEIPPFLTTLCTSMIVRGLGAIIVGGFGISWPTATQPGGRFRSIFKISLDGGAKIPIGIIWILILVTVMSCILNDTVIGRYAVGIGSNKEAAKLSGVNIRIYHVLAYSISGLFTGLAAIAYSAVFATVQPGTGAGFELEAIGGAIIGGVSATGGSGSVAGAMFGVLVICLLKTGLPFIGLQANWQQIITGLVLIGAIMTDTLHKKRKRMVSLSALAALLVAGTLFTGCAAGGRGAGGGKYSFEILVKSYQSSYWQAALKGVEQAKERNGVNVHCNGPNAESDVADQVNMLYDAISKKPDGIGMSACDQEAVLDALQAAKDAGIPVVMFDSGVPDAPEGSVYSTIATDNYGAGGTAAENMYAALRDKIIGSVRPVRIGVVAQDATSASITVRGLGFIDRFLELVRADGKTAAVTGNEYYINHAKDPGTKGGADVVIEAAVPAATTVELCATEASNILNKSDTIGIFGSNQVSSEGILTANGNLGLLGSDPAKNILAAGFDAGSTIKDAVKDGTMIGAVTQSPLEMGSITIDVLTGIAEGETAGDIATEGRWYNADTMDDPEIAPNLYD